MDKNTFDRYTENFLCENSKINLISKNDEKLLWEKHIFDSLSIEKFFQKYDISNLNGKKLLDIGTGGGFPSVPIAINYPELNVVAIDSIRKKINSLRNLKDSLNLDNLNLICERAENIKNEKFDFITSRAVAALKILIPYAIPLLKDDGYFVVYKSVKVNDEIKEAKQILEKYSSRIEDIIEYDLPLEENYTRNLVIIKKK